MPKGIPPARLQEILRRPNPCVVASIRPDGELHTTPTWYEWTNDCTIVMNLAADRLRLRNLKEDPRIALSVVDQDNWRVHVSLIGHVISIRRDTDLKDIDRIALRYTGKAHRIRDRERWTVEAEILRWHSFAMGSDLTQSAGESLSIGGDWRDAG